MFIIVDEFGDRIVMPSRHHSAGCFVRADCDSVSTVKHLRKKLVGTLHFFSYVGLSSVFGA